MDNIAQMTITSVIFSTRTSRLKKMKLRKVSPVITILKAWRAIEGPEKTNRQPVNMFNMTAARDDSREKIEAAWATIRDAGLLDPPAAFTVENHIIENDFV